MSTHRYPGGVISATPPTASSSGAVGVWTLEEALRNKAAGNWPDGTGYDPYFKNTTLLLHGDGTNGAQNNTFLDGSTNNFTITRNGNTTQGSFDPYAGPGCWSNYFNGSTDYFTSTTASSAYDLSSGNWTIEAWIYLTTASTQALIVNLYATANNNSGLTFYVTSSGQLTTDNGVTGTTPAGTIPVNTWTHVAAVRNSGATQLYVNGAAVGSTISQAPNTATNFIVGRLTNTVIPAYFPGYISNLRVIKGAALYTANFTPSTTPLVATSQTILLTCNNNGFNDVSANNNAVTLSGTPKVSKFSPFTLYQTTPASYSGYFDGTGDYLSSTTNSAYGLGSGDFTIEYWAYYNTLSGSPIGFDTRSSSGDTTPSDYVNTSGNVIFYYNSAALLTTSNAVTAGTWNHIAWVRSGSRLTGYINGVSGGSVTTSANFGSSQPLRIAGNITAANFINGSISNMRFTKGVAVYTANFTPGTAPLTATTTVPSNQSWSTSFDGTGDYLTLTSSTALPVGTENFTVEMWVYKNNAWNTGNQVLLCSGVNGSFQLWVDSATNSIKVSYLNSTTILTYSAASLSINTWYHLAVVRSGNSFALYVNGSSVTTATDTGSFIAPATIYIANYYTGAAYWNGFISNLRITKGQALYTSTFTPSTSPLTTTSQGAIASNVSLLTCQNILIQDNSNNLFAVTPVGDAKSTSVNPFVSTNGIGGTSYSGAFDGTGDYLTLPAPAATTIGTSNFTWEAWIFPRAVGTFSVIYDTNASGDATGTGRFLVTLESSGQIKLTTNAGTTTLLASTVNLISNNWVHLAITRLGTSGYMFFNGAQVATGTFSTNFLVATSGATNRPIIGANGYNTSNGFSGSISNLRLVIGSALYTSNFSPSTTPLTAVANTQLLTCQSTTFVDNSTNAIAITAAGDAKTDTFNPFSGATELLTCQNTTFIDNSAIAKTLTANGNATPKAANPFTDTVTGPTAYSTSVYGGSAYFDGTGDYLSLASNAAFALPGDFTFEAWVNFSTTSAGQIFEVAVTSGFQVYYNASIFYVSAYGNVALITYAYTLKPNSWFHVAVTRSGTNLSLYINGALASSVTSSFSFVQGPANIGGISNYLTGYISNLRLVKGTALYTGPFVPPAAPVTAVTNTQLLVNATNGGIFDNTTVNDIETVGSAQVNTTIVKYGTGSMYFNGVSGTYIKIPSTPNLALGSGDWTIECWAYYASIGGAGNGTLYEQRDGTNTAVPLIYLSGSTLIYYATGAARITGGTMSTGQWYHIAVCKASGSTRMFVNGTQVGSTYADTTTYVQTPVFLGSDYNGTSNLLNGYIDDMRVTKGYARYTTNFTPPTAAFPNF